ncbi:MAG TPA: sulfotransferase [Longimicrobiaceae bacterium]|nr:sulfotransferase [Longimicrobiaceae bacterium]
MTAPATVIYIASDNRSGSTLLDQLLGGHPAAVSVGELRRLADFVRRDEPCTCGLPVRECPFWGPVLAAEPEVETAALPRGASRVAELGTQALLLAAPRPLLGRAKGARARAEGCWRVADRAAAEAGAGWVVDSSKTPEQLRMLSLARPDALRVIFLVRDGRGVALSKAQRRGMPFWRGVVSWTASNLRLLMALRSVPASRRLTVRYEALCEDPEREMRRIAEFAGLPYDPALTRLDRSGRHNIGGSPHRFDAGPATIRLDDRWHGFVRGSKAVQFGVLGGWLNALLGYRRR